MGFDVKDKNGKDSKKPKSKRYLEPLMALALTLTAGAAGCGETEKIVENPPAVEVQPPVQVPEVQPPVEKAPELERAIDLVITQDNKNPIVVKKNGNTETILISQRLVDALLNKSSIGSNQQVNNQIDRDDEDEDFDGDSDDDFDEDDDLGFGGDSVFEEFDEDALLTSDYYEDMILLYMLMQNKSVTKTYGNIAKTDLALKLIGEINNSSGDFLQLPGGKKLKFPKVNSKLPTFVLKQGKLVQIGGRTTSIGKTTRIGGFGSGGARTGS